MTVRLSRHFPHLEPLEDRRLLDVAPVGPINDPDNLELYTEAYHGGINVSLASVDVLDQMRIRTAKDAVELRQEIVDFIWKKDGFPDQLFPAVEKGVASPLAEFYPELPNLARIDRLTVTMPYGLQSFVYFFHPTESADRLLIWHQGHDADLVNAGGYLTVAEFLGRGYSVLASWMPFLGDNTEQPAFQIGDCIIVPAHGDHEELACAESETFSPLRFFLDPVVVSLNYALRETPFKDVAMVGLSGGGWTTTLVAAVDPRVRVSVPVAGTLPFYMRVAPYEGDYGDWEQSGSALYWRVDYLDLYVLGAFGPGRRQVQVVNKYDDCCYTGVRFRAYLDTVRDVLADVGPGEFTAFLDDSLRPGYEGDIHQVSAHAVATLLTRAAEDDPARFVDDGENTYWNGGGSDRDTFLAWGAWSEVRGAAFAGDAWVAEPGPGDAHARWQFRVTPGRYQIAVTWNPGFSPLPGRAPFSIQNGSRTLARVAVDQREAPADFYDGQVGWHVLGEFNLTTPRLLVWLANTPESIVVADGVRLTPVGPPPLSAAWVPDNILSLLAEQRLWRKFPW